MGNADSTHFDRYRTQTRVKHRILEAYLPQYFHILKKWQKNLVFIDGFAGPGAYRSEDGEVDGSPIRALKVLSGHPKLAAQVACVFFEENRNYFDGLQARVAAFSGKHALAKTPLVGHGKFSERIDELLASVDGGDTLAPTFLFVDPCGCDDVSMQRIANVLSRDSCETFIFFNVTGVKRISGLVAEPGAVSKTLVGLYGNEGRALAAIHAAQSAETPAERERLIIQHYRDALEADSTARFLLPLRIEDEVKRSTSHYLIHASKHPLGFKIMKDVMWAASDNVVCEGNVLALLQASTRHGQSLFRDPALDRLSAAVLQDLASGTQPVIRYYEGWTKRPDDLFATSVYRSELIRLEEEGLIEVLAADATTPKPASERPRPKGAITLSDKHYVRLAK